MEIVGLGYMGLESKNTEGWRTYAPEVLGMAVRPSDGPALLLRMDDRNHRIAIRPGDRDRLSYIGWELLNRPAWEEALQILAAEGYAPEIADPGLREERAVHAMAWIHGPDDVRHEFYYGHGFDSHTFLPGRPHNGFVTGEGGFGHVVLTVPAWTDELNHFIEDVLKFKWFGSGADTGKRRFYRPRRNHRTHAIGYSIVPGVLGLQHVGIEVHDLDDVGIAYDRVLERGDPLMATLGRHTQDPVISFYAFTPSGFPLEYINAGVEDSEVHPFVEGKPESLSIWGHKFNPDAPKPSTMYSAAESVTSDS
ncbi:2,3-dihydroxybiphenyl 1,2-dioxygenase [Actinocorallia herbida]|uniref:2,3-dihydroxybiphenyl 1,2-dioxygenase n=1 Tax=Actinocorallia herbida TaxID=58109 RepID=A0A3N1D381_9ACTN|nr:VOC family protein [Actinocorallia herbida]ROO87997.1 2,3-dihydroxybiphenyl 1,2-dioxygenase [Actinocorallia herbida]